MTLVYNITNSYGVLTSDCKAFLLGMNEDLTIKFEGTKIDKCFVLLECAGNSNKFSAENLNEIVVPKDLLAEGTLKVKVFQFNRTKVKTITCEPISIISEDEGFKGNSAFEDMEARVKELEEKVDKLMPLLKDVEGLYSALEQ